MSVPGLDFGLFIAYVTPGMIALFALSLVSSHLRDLWQGAGDKPTTGTAVIVMLLALVFGRILSISRVVAIDSTFRVPLPFVSCGHAPHRGAIVAVEPDYRQLADAGRREAFRLAIANEQRPFQFGGNTAIAIVLLTGCWIVSLSRSDRRRPRVLMAILGTAGLVIVLYAGARVSHYRFVRAVAALNGVELRSSDRSGQPCQAGDAAALKQAG